MLYRPHIILVHSSNGFVKFLIDPHNQNGSGRAEQFFNFLQKRSNFTIIDEKKITDYYVFGHDTIDTLKSKISLITNTNEPFFVYASDINIEVISANFFNINNAPLNQSVSHRATTTCLARIIPHLYDGIIFFCMPKSILGDSVYASLATLPMEMDVEVLEMERTFLEKIGKTSIPEFVKQNQEAVIEILQTVKIPIIKLLDIYLSNKFNNAALFIPTKFRLLFHTKNKQVMITKYEEIASEYNLQNESIIALIDKIVICQDKIIYPSSEALFVMELVQEFDISIAQRGDAQTFVVYEIQGLNVLNVNRVHGSVTNIPIFIQATKSYNVFNAIEGNYVLLLSKTKIALSVGLDLLLDELFIQHIINYVTYLSIPPGEMVLETRFGKLQGVYWSKICQNSGNKFRKPIQLDELPPEFLYVTTDQGNYWSNGTTQAIRIDNKYFMCTDSTYSNIGILKKLYDTFGVCRPCCFMQSMVNDRLFKTCTQDKIEKIKDIEDPYSLPDSFVDPYILNARVFIAPGKLSFLFRPHSIFLNSIFEENTIKFQNNRLVETSGYFLVTGKTLDKTAIELGNLKNVLIFLINGQVEFRNIDSNKVGFLLATERRTQIYQILKITKEKGSDYIKPTKIDMHKLLLLFFKSQLPFYSLNSHIHKILKQPTVPQITIGKKFMIEQTPGSDILYTIPSHWTKLPRLKPYTYTGLFFAGIEMPQIGTEWTGINLFWYYFNSLFYKIQAFDSPEHFVLQMSSFMGKSTILLSFNQLNQLLYTLNRRFLTNVKLVDITQTKSTLTRNLPTIIINRQLYRFVEKTLNENN